MKKLKITIILSLIIIMFGNVVLSNAIVFEGKIHKNIYVRDMDLSNLTKEEAKEKINQNIYENNSFVLMLDDNQYIFDKECIEVNYNVDDLVEEAYNIGRSENIIKNIKTKGELRKGRKIILDYSISFNEKKLDKYLKDLNKQIYLKPINSTIRIKSGEIIVTKDKDGYKLNKDELKNIIIFKIKEINSDEEKIPIISIKPSCTHEDLKKINSILGRFETYFNSKNYNRVNNIKLAADATSNILINSGDIFSFNSYIKESKIDKHLKEATVIINGKKEQGIGGGICQVSTTIYNAALYSGLKIKSVKNHSVPSAYIEMGRDATVSDSGIDFKFYNNYDTPVLLHNEVVDNKIVSTIYGNEKHNKDIEVITEVTDTIYNKIIRKNSEEYDSGLKTVEQEGRKGYKVRTYRVYKSDFGKKAEYICESYYPPQDKIIIYGTKGSKAK